MAQLPYELMDMIRNGGSPVGTGGQQIPLELLAAQQNGGLPTLYQPRPSQILPGVPALFAPPEPKAGDIQDQRYRAQRYMGGQQTPVAQNATDFPIQQGALYRPGDETLALGSNGESTAQSYAQTLLDSGQNYPNGMPQPWNRPNGAMVSDNAPGVTVSATDTSQLRPDMPRQMPASPSVGIPQPPVAFNTPQESGVAGNNYTSGSTTTNPQQGALAQPQAQPESNAMMMGLLAAGLGILANNTGNYGQAGPAIGRGGLIGVKTYLDQKQQEIANQRLAQQMAMEQQMNQAKIGNYQSEDQKRQADIKKINEEINQKKNLQDAYNKALAGIPPEQLGDAMADPKTHFKVAAMLGGIDPRAAKEAMDAGVSLEKNDNTPKTAWIPAGNDEKGNAVEALGIWNPKNKTYERMPNTPTRPIFNTTPQNQVTLKVDNFVPASEEAQHEYIKETRDSYNKLKTAPFILGNIDKAKQLAQTAFVGAGASTKKDIVKFFNNNLGTNIDSEAVASTEELKSRLFTQVMENLRKMDAQPTERQQNMMQEALGNIENDPKALPRVLDVMSEIVRQKVAVHNKDVQSAIGRGVKFPYDPVIELPPQAKSAVRTGTYQGRRVIEYSDGSVEFAQ